MKRPSIKCPECAGAGTIPLPPHLEQTLADLGKLTKPAEYLAVRGLTVNAISNRLSDLLRLGLVTRHKEGRQWFYRAVKPKAAGSAESAAESNASANRPFEQPTQKT